MCLVHLSELHMLPRRKYLFRFVQDFFFHANNSSRNIIIIEFITFFIFFASQYFSFTLFRTTHDIIPPHKTWNFPCFFLFFAGFCLVLWFYFCNICRSMCVHAVYENIFTGKTLNNFSSFSNICFFYDTGSSYTSFPFC